MKAKIILDLCGGTGSWSKPYKDAGYDVRNITLPDYDVRWWLCEQELKKDIKNVYGILAAPPCTHFSLARTTVKTPRDFIGAMEIVGACLHIIWNIRADHKLAFWCLENPMGYLRQFLGKPAFTFDPCDFGDHYTKKTDLWGYFNFPKKKPVQLSEEEIALCKMNNRKLPSIRGVTSSNQAARRAITPPGFAKAFFKANQ